MGNKKVGTAGRFGPRYGKRIREKVSQIEALSRKRYRCPFCDKDKKVKRVVYGIWQCKNCEKKFVGGAYKPY